MRVINQEYLDDLRYIGDKYSSEIHSALKKRINARVYVAIRNNTLYFSVNKDTIMFEYQEDGIMDRIIDNISVGVISQELFDLYKHYILNYFFY